MKNSISVALGLVILAGVAGSGCESTGVRKEEVGTAVGGALGGVLGAQVGEGSGKTAATIAGTIIGAFIGSSIGRTMDEVDRMKTATALETSRTGYTSTWTNPDSGAQYAVTPTRTYATAADQPCREFTMDAWIEGRRETVHGTACRQMDGTWRTI
jgi:surface antigen